MTSTRDFDRIHEAETKIKNLSMALDIAYSVLEQVVIDPALYGMPITDEEHPWHEDIYKVRELAGWGSLGPPPKTVYTLDEYIREYLLKGERGGFAAELAEAWCVADGENKARLQVAFPNVFTVPEHLQ